MAEDNQNAPAFQIFERWDQFDDYNVGRHKLRMIWRR